MADEFDEEMGDRLVIADEDRMDCTSSGDIGGTSALALPFPEEYSKSPKVHKLALETENFNPDNVKDSINSAILSPVDSSTGQIIAPDSTDGNSPLKMEECLEVSEEEKIVSEKTTAKRVLPFKCEKQHDQRKSEFDSSTTKRLNHALAEDKNESSHVQVHNFLVYSGGSKKKKNMVDKSTCVFTKSTGGGLDEHLMSMRPGTNLTIDIAIICKAGGNTLYISAKWKERDYHGVLTDGEPLYSHICSQKRNSAGHYGSKIAGTGNAGGGLSDRDGSVTGERATSSSGSGKARGGKRGSHASKNGASEKRAKNLIDSNGQSEDNALNRNECVRNDQQQQENNSKTSPAKITQKDANLLHPPDSTGTGSFSINSHISGGSNTSSLLLHTPTQPQRRRRLSSSASQQSTAQQRQGHGLNEVEDKLMTHRCPHRQCGFRFESSGELNTHLLVGHGTPDAKATTFESTATQTCLVETVSTGCNATNHTPFPPIFCTKCKHKLTTPFTDGESIVCSPKLTSINRPAALECASENAKVRMKDGTNVVNESSPTYSDISDDAAPTLEKEIVDDLSPIKQQSKQILDQQQSSSLATSNEEDGDGSVDMMLKSSGIAGQQQQDGEERRNADASCHGAEDNSQLNLNFLQVADKQQQPRPSSTATTASTSSLMAQMPLATANFHPSFLAAVAVPQSMGTTNAATAAATIFSPFIPIPPPSQFNAQVLASTGQTVGTISTVGDNVIPAASCSSKLMPPPPPGLLSLGTPIASTANGTAKATNTEGISQQQIHHKIYELQQHHALTNPSSSSTITRSSSTKPAAQYSNGSSVSPTPSVMMRPNSAIAGAGAQQTGNIFQQRAAGMMLHHSSLLQQQQQFLRANAPSPLSAGFFAAPPTATSLQSHPGSGGIVVTPPQPAAMFAAAAAAAAAQQQAIRRGQHQQQQLMAALPAPGGPCNSSIPSTSAAAAMIMGQHQQQMAAAQILPPQYGSAAAGMHGMLAMAAMANLDMNALQQQCAALFASSAGATPSALATMAQQSQQQSHPHHQQTPK